jgi:serine/threonine-protein kinase RsbW
MHPTINLKGLSTMNDSLQAGEYQPSEIALNIPATYTYLNVISACIGALLERVGELPDRNMITYQVRLAVHEACTNIVEHAYAGDEGRILVIFSFENNLRRLVIRLEDSGKAFQLTGYQQPNIGEAQVSGYGLFLMHQLMDEVTYHPLPGKNQWRLVKNFLD